MDQELYETIQQLQHDSYYRTAAGDYTRIVDSPFIGGPLSSAFERLTRFSDSIREIGRMGIHEIHYICVGLDVVADSLDVISNTMPWTRDGAITVRRMAGGRC